MSSPWNHGTSQPSVLLCWSSFLLCIRYIWLWLFLLLSGYTFCPCCGQQWLSTSGFEAWNLKEVVLNLPLLLSKANLHFFQPLELLSLPGLHLRWFFSPSLTVLPIGLAPVEIRTSVMSVRRVSWERPPMKAVGCPLGGVVALAVI